MATRSTSARGPSQRQLRAGELIRHAIDDILRREDLRDPDLARASITVSEVRASPDLRQATVYCAPLGASVGAAPGGAGADAIRALNRAAPHIRHLLASRIDMKFTPSLRFVLDDSFAEARRVDELLARPEVRRDLDREP